MSGNYQPELIIDENRQAYQRSLSDIYRRAGRSDVDQTISNSFYGFNMSGRNSGIALNTENHGYTFFTRPLMNMSYNNLIVDRVLSNLVNERTNSLARMIRTTFDPLLEANEKVTVSGVDQLNAFIPLLSNNLISLSGFQDFTLNTNMQQPGLYREVYGYTDDIPYNYSSYDITANFRNLEGDPISFMMLMWGWYQGLVYEGRIWPHPELIATNEIDYQTRIYRLVMDSTRKFVTRIGATGVSWPIVAPIGNIFNFEGDGSQSPFTTANDQISINFRTLGFTYYDNILIYEFNKVVTNFNKHMEDGIRTSIYYKLRDSEKPLFEHRTYPRINPLTLELEWWVSKQLYHEIFDIAN